MGDLQTTNTALIVMAVVSVLEALVVIGIGIGAFVAYRRVMGVVNDLEERHVAPLTGKVNGILDDVKAITAKAQLQAERVDQAIAGTMDRVDVTADRVKHSVMDQVSRVTSVVRGVRSALVSVLSSNGRRARTRAEPQPYAGTGTDY